MGMMGFAIGYGADGKVHARLMGGPDQCLALDDLPYYRWCVLPYPHEGEHQYNRTREEGKQDET